MNTTAKIKIERVERKCPYNDDVHSGKITGHPIYDWNVLVDGDYRAQFRPGVYKGYSLFNVDGFKIQGASNWGIHARRSDVAAKAEFEGKIRECLDKLLIPTLAQLAEARTKRQQEREADEAARKERIRAERIREAAPDMLATLREAEEYLDDRADVDDGIPDHAMRLLVEVRAAIAKATLPPQERGS